MNEHYNFVRIQGKHGMINLGIPKREATKEEIEGIHRVIAEIIINNYKEEKAKRLES